jgi:sugar-phosphatase
LAVRTVGVVTVLHAEALLFDSDGVLVDSDDVVTAAWRDWAERWNLDPDVVVPQVHGTPSRQTVARFVAEPHRAEALAMVDRIELERASEARAMPGASVLLSSLTPGTWAIVTSGTRALALARLTAAGLDVPDVLVTADEVTRGKPDPEPYLAAAGLLGRPPADCLVFEDSAPGVAAARSARVRHVVGVGRRQPDIDAFVPDLRSVSVYGSTVRCGGGP